MLQNDILINSVDMTFGDAHFMLHYIVDSNYMENKAQVTLSSLYHRHLRFELHAENKGSLTVNCGNQRILVSCGEGLLIPPNTEHYTVRNTEDTEDMVLAITMDRTEGEEHFYDYLYEQILQKSLVSIKFSEELLQKISDYLKFGGENDMRSICVRKFKAYEIMILLFENLDLWAKAEFTSEQSRSKAEQTSIHLETLVDRIDYPLTQIASDLGYSVRHTLRLIKKKYGKNLNEIRTERMLNSAKRMLLEERGISLNDVAFRAGFSGISAMRRVFVNNCGCTPSEFRKNGGNK